MKEKSVIDILLDDSNNDDIVLYDENDKETIFSQIAIISLGEKTYAILKPIEKIDGIEDDEALTFLINEEDEENPLELCDDMQIIQQVFDEYYKLINEED